MKRAVLLAIAALACGLGAREAWGEAPHLNQKIADKKISIRKAVLLPAQVSFTKVGGKGYEGGLPAADQIAAVLYSTVSKELSLRGMELSANPLEQAKDDAAKYSVADLQARYDTVAVQLERKPKRVARGGFTLGDRVAEFEPGAAADVLVFLRGSGQLATPARTVIALASMRFPETKFRGEVTFVDAKTGEVLMFVRFTRFRDMTTKTDERFTQSLRLALHDVPLPLPPPKN
jgi:hypothetical protein